MISKTRKTATPKIDKQSKTVVMVAPSDNPQSGKGRLLSVLFSEACFQVDKGFNRGEVSTDLARDMCEVWGIELTRGSEGEDVSRMVILADFISGMLTAPTLSNVRLAYVERMPEMIRAYAYELASMPDDMAAIIGS